MSVFGVVEEVLYKLPSPDNRWPTCEQMKRLYERATIKVLLRRLDDDEQEGKYPAATLKMMCDGLMTIEDTNPNAPGVRIAIDIIQDLMEGNNDG